MQLSIVIVNWNSKDFVRKCLHSLNGELAGIDSQIIVVDGGSFDGCGDMLAVEFPQVEFIQAKENLGFGKSNNLGVLQARGKYLWLLNPDTEVDKGTVEILLSSIKSLPHAGVIGARLFNTDGSLQRSCVRSLPTPLNAAIDSDILRKLFPTSKRWGTSDAFASKAPIEVEAVSGASMMMAVETFRNVGGFSPEFFMYGEDMDLCFKVKKNGLKNYFIPGARIIHHGGGSSRTQVSQFSTRRMREAAEIYMRRNHGIRAAVLYRFLQGLSACVRLFISGLLWIFSRGPRRESAKITLKKWWYVLRWVLKAESTA